MKIKKLTIEAQQICLQEVNQVFEALVNKMTEMEKDARFYEQPTLEMEPYNRGYQIKIEAFLEYRNKRNEKTPSLMHTPFLHPGTFFEENIRNGDDGHIEFGYMRKDPFSGYSTGRANVITMGQFQTYASAWTEGMIKQIEEL